MPSIPGFWEGGPHQPIDVEQSWREFVRCVGGQVVEDIVPEPRIFENADFLFPDILSVAELKEIQTEFNRFPAFQKGFEALLARLTQSVRLGALNCWAAPVDTQIGSRVNLCDFFVHLYRGS